jgi:S-adenosylmethionine decarboxylase proenzyme
MSVVPTKGTHIVFDCWGCDSEILADHSKILGALRAGVSAAGATIIHEHAHDFDGDGVSAILILQESHASSHGWPSKGFASFDMYTCGLSDPLKAVGIIINAVRATKTNVTVLTRGCPKGAASNSFVINTNHKQQKLRKAEAA